MQFRSVVYNLGWLTSNIWIRLAVNRSVETTGHPWNEKQSCIVRMELLYGDLAIVRMGLLYGELAILRMGLFYGDKLLVRRKPHHANHCLRVPQDRRNKLVATRTTIYVTTSPLSAG